MTDKTEPRPQVGHEEPKKADPMNRVALVGVGLFVAGLFVLGYSASVLTLTCRAEDDPSPQRAGWCELREMLAFGWWEAPRRRFLAKHFTEAQPEIAFNKQSGRVQLMITNQRKPIPLGHHRSQPRERAEEINALFRERNDGPIHYEEGYSATGMILGVVMIFTGFYLALRAIFTSNSPRVPPAAPASTEKKTQ